MRKIQRYKVWTKIELWSIHVAFFLGGVIAGQFVVIATAQVTPMIALVVSLIVQKIAKHQHERILR